MKNIIITMMLITVLFACSTVIKSKKDLENIAIVHYQVTSGEASKIIKSGSLSETDIMIVDHANNRYIAFISKWKQEVDNLESTSPLFEEFVLDYTEITKQYHSVRTIINKNWGSYSLPNQIVLLEYQSKVNKLDESVTRLIVAKNMYEAGIIAIKLGKALVGIIL